MSNSHFSIHTLEPTTKNFLEHYFQYFCELKRIKFFKLNQFSEFVASELGCFGVTDSFLPTDKLPEDVKEAPTDLRIAHLVQVRDPRDLLVSLHANSESSRDINELVLDPINIKSIKNRFQHLMNELSQTSFNRSHVSVLRYEDLHWHMKRWVRETLSPLGDRNWYFAVRLHRMFEQHLAEHFQSAPNHSQPCHYMKVLSEETITQLNSAFEMELRSFYPASLARSTAA